MENHSGKIGRKRRNWPLVAAGLFALMTSITALPAMAGEPDKHSDPADAVLTAALAADELAENRAAGVGPMPVLDPRQSQDVAVILWDELGRNGGIISAGNENVNVSVTINY